MYEDCWTLTSFIVPALSSHRFVGGPEGAERPRRIDACYI